MYNAYVCVCVCIVCDDHVSCNHVDQNERRSVVYVFVYRKVLASVCVRIFLWQAHHYQTPSAITIGCCFLAAHTHTTTTWKLIAQQATTFLSVSNDIHNQQYSHAIVHNDDDVLMARSRFSWFRFVRICVFVYSICCLFRSFLFSYAWNSTTFQYTWRQREGCYGNSSCQASVGLFAIPIHLHHSHAAIESIHRTRACVCVRLHVQWHCACVCVTRVYVRVHALVWVCVYRFYLCIARASLHIINYIQYICGTYNNAKRDNNNKYRELE